MCIAAPWGCDAMTDPAFLEFDGTAPKQRARPVQREHARQIRIKLFVRDAVTAPHKFLAFDRTRAHGRFSHMRERARGIAPNTPDTLLIVAGMPCIWAEIKDRGQWPGADQLRMLEELRALGTEAFWTDSVVGYYLELAKIGVPMRSGAGLVAAAYDNSADAVIERAEMKRGKVPARLRVSKTGNGARPSRKGIKTSDMIGM